jgi:PEGA domain
MESGVQRSTELQSIAQGQHPMITASLKHETPPATDLVQLVAKARAAYEQKRLKECVDLTKQVLLADTRNAEALALQAEVASDIQRDLTDARALLDDSRKMADGQKYRKAAEIVLLKILYIDPSHTDAKSLLAASKSTSRGSEALEQIAFTAHPEPVERRPKPRSLRVNVKMLIAAGIALFAGGLWLLRSYATGNYPGPAAPVVAVASAAPATVAAGALPTPPPVVAPPVVETTESAPAAVVPPPPAVEPPAPPVAPPKAAVKDPGSLAVNSPIAADIYMEGKYLGATPTTLQLPPGRHTLEYRHGELRAVMTHEVKSKETSSALVTFETTVQVNARPWAQVFVEGSTRRALGQTPLGSIRVPIGSVLTFENPNFPPKSHRVKESDSAIQMVFP